MATATPVNAIDSYLFFDRAAADAHVMQPSNTVNIVSSRGRDEGQLEPPSNGPSGGPMAFNTDGFVQALNNALAANTAGYAMELREHGQIIASMQSGGAHLPVDGSEPWNESVAMHVASCSKLVTAIAMVRTLAAHNVSADTPIIGYLPTYWQKGQNIDKITFKMLMTHTSGFHVVTSDSTYPWMKSQVAAGVASADLGVYTYQNMNYGLCRILIPIMNGNIPAGQTYPAPNEDSDWDYATIQAYVAYVTKYVFQPSGVSDATLTHPAQDALAYSFPPGSGWNSGDISANSGGAGWHMSVADLLNIMGTLRRGGSIMSASAAQAMLDDYFGIDIQVSTQLGTVYNKNGLWQSGSGAGAQIEQTLAYFLPLDMELVVFANSPISAANTFFRDLVTNLYVANIAPAIGTGGWIAHYGMTAEQFQETFNNLVLNEGMELTDISGYGANGNLYAAIWVKNANPPAWEARNGMTEAEYQTTFNQMTAGGFAPVLVDGYAAGGQTNFAAIWQKGNTDAWVARDGLSSAQYQQEFNQYVAQGYSLDWISGYSQGGQDVYAAVWRKIPGIPAWETKAGMTAAEYQQFFNQMTGQGYTLYQVCGYGVGNQPLYAAIFRKIANPPAWVSHNGMTAAQFQQTFNQLFAQGYALKQISGYSFAGQDQFAGIWSK
jgi:CubicO group peptidase (beta-lactamase class C family)